ncbi:MAG: hypothetical protein H0U65_03245 [Rubrobacter sp.]|nr:hypothetical protein [Rubrobacter sp.]
MGRIPLVDENDPNANPEARAALMEIWALVGVANMINRFHATFHTDVDEEIMGSLEPASCPIELPGSPSNPG